LQWFEGRGLLETVDGLGDPDSVAGRMIEIIDKHRGA
jgi:hypothetical protein